MGKLLLNVLICIIMLLAFCGCNSRIPLSDNIVLKPIVIPEKSSDNVDTAAQELQKYLGKVTGKEFKIISEKDLMPSQKGIFLGNTLEAKKAGIETTALPPQTWRIKTFDGNLIITGGGPDDLGTLLGTYRFLDKQLGVKFYAWDCTVVPKRKELFIPELDITQSPSFEYRHIYDGLLCSHGGKGRKITKEKKAQLTFMKRNGASNALKPATPRFNYSWQLGRTIHDFYLYVPPEKYFKAHPEYYTMDQKGVRTSNGGHQLCLSNPEVQKIVKETILANIAKDRQEKPVGYPTVYDFSQEDSSSYMCKCPECMKIINQYGGFKKYGDSSLLFHFLNPIAEEIAKKYPDVYLRTFCYVSTELANPNIKPAKNIVLQYCNLYSRCDIFRPLTHPNNKEQLKKLTDWTRQSENIQLWDYGNMGNSIAIDTMVDAIIENLRLYRDNKLAGIMFEYEEGEYRPQSFIDLHYYLYSQLMLDADQNAEKLINGFMDAYYGEAAPIMKQYLSKLRNAVKDEKKPLVWTTGIENRPYQTLEFMSDCRNMLLKAMNSVANNNKVLTRVIRELNVVDSCLIKYLRNRPDPSGKLTLEKIIKEYEKNMNIAFKGLLISPAGIEEMQKRLKDEINIFNLKIDPPPQLANVPKKDLKYVVYPDFQPYIDCRRFNDPDSDMPEVMQYVSKDTKNHTKPPVFGVYDQISKACISKYIDNVPIDEKYHWYKIGRFSIGSRTTLWGHCSWHMGAKLFGVYVPADGVKNDPNLYDVWVSAKITGPAYVKGSKKENIISIDKIILCRPQEKQ